MLNLLRKIICILTVLLAVTSASAQIHVSNDTTICYGESVSLQAVVDLPNDFYRLLFENSDQVYDSVFEIGFDFQFFGQTYNQFVIGANGWISFDTDRAGTYDYYSPKVIPSLSDTVPKNSIMAPWQDWYPANSSVSYVGYETVGDPGNYQCVISYFNVPLGTQSGKKGTFQIILNETDNSIENHITRKDSIQFLQNIATQGIHNINGTKAFTVPGRNGTSWTAYYDAWKYTPDISSDQYTVEMIDHDPILSGELSHVMWFKNYFHIDSIPFYTGNSLTVTPSQTTTYYAMVLLNEAVPFVDSVTITVSPPLIAKAGNDTLIDVNTFAFLDAEHEGGIGNITYRWEPSSLVVDPDAKNTTTVSLNQTTVFKLALEDELGCLSDTSEKVVAVEFSALFVNLSVDKNKVCPFDTVTLEASAFGGNINFPYTYTWWSEPGAGSYIVYDSIVRAIPEVTTKYFVEVTDIDNNKKIDSITVNVPELNPVIFGDTNVCELSTTVYITDSSGNYFTWHILGIEPVGFNTENNQIEIQWNQPDTGSIQVIEIYEGQSLVCRDTSYFPVTVYPNPEPVIFSQFDTVCKGTTGAQYAPISTSGNNYLWEIIPASAGLTSVNDSVYFIVDWVQDGSATVVLTETSSIGCTSEDYFEVMVNPLPEPEVIGQSSVCLYDTVTYYSPYLSGHQYSWSMIDNGIGEMLSSGSDNEFTVYWKNPGKAYLLVHEINSATTCEDSSDTLEVIVHARPDFSATPADVSVCKGDSNIVYLTGTDMYAWEPDTGFNKLNDSTWIVNPDTTTQYFIIGIDALTGCFDSIDYFVEIRERPVLDLGDDMILPHNTPILLNAGGGNDSYYWNTGDTDSTIYITSPGEYWVRVGLNECYKMDSIYITLSLQSLPVPNAFSPNNDGLNDVFNIVYQTYSLGVINNYLLQIYDRWGKLVFESNDPEKGWDGSSNGSLCPPGTYVYVINFEEYTSDFPEMVQRKGVVTLLR